MNNYPPETLASDTIDFNATSGTPTMQMVWLLFSKTLIGRPLTASRSGEVSELDFTFEIHADFVPEKTKNEITELAFKERNKVLKQVTFEQFNEYKDLAFTSEPMVSLYKEAIRAGSHEMPVCITGEPGTEKKAIALLIHKESEFSNGPFVNFDFQSVDSYEIDDFLFDTRKMLKGKTVIQKAALGTLYLENIENLRLSGQRKLIEIINKFETDLLKLGSKPSDSKKFRFIFSTSANLEELMKNKTIDEEFYFLISSSRIRVPSIAERADDIPKIAEEMLSKVNKLLRQSVGFGEKKFSEAAIKLIKKRRWVGNF